MNKYTILLAMLLISGIALRSQTTYTCDFEDPAEHSLWQLNPGNQGPKCVNRWHIGTGSSNGGRHALYISSDGGATDRYSLNADFTVAWRPLTLDPGDYELSFDLNVGGTSYDVLYVAWIPASQPTNCNEKGFVPDWVSTYSLVFDRSDRLHNIDWQPVYSTFKTDGQPGKLVFMWANGEGRLTNPSASIDNINIIPVNSCPRPTDIDYTNDASDVTVVWDGNSSAYDIRYKKSHDTAWCEIFDIPENKVLLQGITEGMYDIYVRGVCDSIHSAWTFKSFFLFYKGVRCVDFLDLHGDATDCYYGYFNHPDATTGVIDSGYTSAASRHTLHYDPAETDPRTGDMLYTVHSSDIASVRLGNWSNGAEAEMIEYDYYVDPQSSSILLLNYAVVLQNPGHAKQEQPRFTLRLMDEYGYDLGGDGCSKADFIPGYNTGDDWITYDSIEWLDWSVIGLNLAEYSNRKLKIKLTTRDCSLSAHYGYSYFTVGCSDGRITALSCGTESDNKFKAPDGFFYRWYREGTPEVTYSTMQVIDVPQTDTATYYCDVIQRTNTQCYFTVSAKALPRIPHPDASFEVDVVDCRNMVHFTNTSRVLMFNPVTNDTIDTDTPCDGVLWDFGDGTTSAEWSPSHSYPAVGGRYTVTVTARLADCEETRSFDITLPDITTPGDTVRHTTCYGEPYLFGDEWRFSEGTYYDTLVSSSLCDSVVVLLLSTRPKFEHRVSDTVCSVSLPYIFGTQQLNESGTYTEVFESADGCDSTVHLTLTVNTSLILELGTDRLVVCADDTVALLPYTLASGMITSFDMTTPGGELSVKDGVADGTNLHIPLPDSILPGSYDATFLFRNMDCGDVEQHLRLDVYYAASVVTQRWNDVLGVHNADYNGGYHFVAYQWHKDGEPLPGEINANYYTPAGLDTEAQYSVLLTRTDGTSIYSCPMTPRYFADIEVEPTIVLGGQTVHVSSEVEALVRVRGTTGLLIAEYTLRDGSLSFPAPMQDGVYLIEIITASDVRRVEKIVVTR